MTRSLSRVCRTSGGSVSTMRGIPSPKDRFLRFGSIRASLYSLSVTAGCTLLAIAADRQLRRRGAPAGVTRESTALGVPFGLIGGRAYHVATSWPTYFGKRGLGGRAAINPTLGGLGSWGVVPAAMLGTWIVCRIRGVRMPVYLDSYAAAMAIPVIAIRLGNWCNQELYGKPTTVAWGVQIDPQNRPAEHLDDELFHPIFVYESVSAAAIAPIIVTATRRYQLGHGRAFALWCALYSALRLGLEFVRADPAMRVAGLRINVWVAGSCVAGASTYFAVVGRIRPGIEPSALRALAN